MNEIWKEICLLFAGMMISLLTTLIVWFIPYINNARKKLQIEVRVLEKNEYNLKIKLRFTNKSKLLKYVQNINVYYDESLILAQCENQVDNFKFFCIEHVTNNDTSFSYIVEPETIKECTLSFDSAIELDFTKKFNLWFNNKTYMYKFNINSNSWQKVCEKITLK